MESKAGVIDSELSGRFLKARGMPSWRNGSRKDGFRAVDELDPSGAFPPLRRPLQG
jgi:hypothetical protein